MKGEKEPGSRSVPSASDRKAVSELSMLGSAGVHDQLISGHAGKVCGASWHGVQALSLSLSLGFEPRDLCPQLHPQLLCLAFFVFNFEVVSPLVTKLSRLPLNFQSSASAFRVWDDSCVPYARLQGTC